MNTVAGQRRCEPQPDGWLVDGPMEAVCSDCGGSEQAVLSRYPGRRVFATPVYPGAELSVEVFCVDCYRRVGEPQDS